MPTFSLIAFISLDVWILSIVMLPSFNLVIPAINLPRVDFPEPFFPTMAITSPSFTEKLMFFKI